MTAGQTVTASFGGPQTLAVVRNGTGSGTVSSSPAGINCGATCNASFTYNATVNLTAGASAGSTFTGWTGDCTGASTTCSVTMSQARNVTATFAINPETLTVARNGTGSGTVTSSPAGINCGTACSMTVNYGTMITLTPTPSTGSNFSGWSGACTGTGTCTVPMTAATSVTASFQLNLYQISASMTGDATGTITSSFGISCPGTCSTYVSYGTAVTLTANPGAGAVFAGWSGTCAGQGQTCSFTVAGPQAIGAEFDQSSYTLSVSGGRLSSSPAGINCGSGGACSATFPRGTVVTLNLGAPIGACKPGVPDLDSATWTGTDNDVGSQDTATATVTMYSARTVTVNATWLCTGL
jgi:uncharacterized repeat protein (TIGR02543 family)